LETENPRAESSEAEREHHAFAYFPEEHVLALPIDEGWQDEASLAVIQVDFPIAG